MTEERYYEIDNLLRDSIFRFRWCEPSPAGCACSGCVNVGGISITKEEWQEWALSRALIELGVAKEYIEEFISLKQQKKIPTLQEYRDRLTLIDSARAYLKRTTSD